VTGRKRQTFTTTWWAEAWIEALEQRASIDPNRLPRGRTYARQDRVEGMVLAPGVVSALVHGKRPHPYRVNVWVREFDEGEWDRFLDAVVAKAAHAAALLDGELDPGIVDDAHAVGVDLLPVAGELRPRCSCPDWADPCKHSAAVCYLVAVELGRDPFALLELRGRNRSRVLAELRRRRGAGTSTEESTVEAAPPAVERGIPAHDAWSREVGELPDPPPPRPGPGRLSAWPVDPPADAPFTADGLAAIAGDAIDRGWRMSRGDADSGLGLNIDADLARRAAAALGTDRWGRVVERSGVNARELVRRASAWRHAGEDGLRAVTEARWRPAAAVMVEAKARLVEARVPAGRIRIDRNAVIIGEVQLRVGHDGRWWRFERRSNRWELAAPPAAEPDELWDVEE